MIDSPLDLPKGSAPRLRVLLAQLPVPSNPRLNTPLAAGYLAAYAVAQGLAAQVDIAILPRALADHAGDAALVAAIVARRPHVLGFSLYTWNSERSLAVALRAKAQLPDLLVLVGGPEVQPDNAWIVEHPAVDLAVVGEGEQTFVALLRALIQQDKETGEAGDREKGLRASPPQPPPPNPHLPFSIPGLLARGLDGALHFGGERATLGDLAAVPSPYLGGWLDLPADGMLMVEVSRWCPYSCGFCLYGRNMGPKLGGRYFGLERVLAEIAWGKARGVRQVHFVEANLNLVPLFWPLMRALADLNADRQLIFYAELRGEHLTDAVVAALDAANVRVVEVGLQTANPAALRASYRRTDLAKWAAGTRRLYAHNIEVYLDVILGLPADDAAGVAATLDFIAREGLGPYDIFTLQVLPGTAVRREAEQYAMGFQARPPYYVLGTDRLTYAELRRLRAQLKRAIGLDPAAVEGTPAPRPDALAAAPRPATGLSDRIDLRTLPSRDELAGLCSTDGSSRRLSESLPLSSAPSPSGLPSPAPRPLAPVPHLPDPAALAAHVDVLLPADLGALADLTPLLAAWVAANPTTVFDLYLFGAENAPPPTAAELAAWRAELPFTPGYLDRVGVYVNATALPDYSRVSPRLWLALPWRDTSDPADYAGVAALIWAFEAAADEPLPLGAWRGAGGAGIWLQLPADTPAAQRDARSAAARAWAAEHGRTIWV